MPKPPASLRRRGGKREIVFDPEARREHLRGFSDRKRQRRAFGLAMQKVKDRKAKLEDRKQRREEQLEQIEEAERQKDEILDETMRNLAHLRGEKNVDKSDDEDDSQGEQDEIDSQDGAKVTSSSTKMYNSEKTENKWGGQVIVTTSAIDLDGNLSDEADDDDNDAVPEKNARGRAPKPKAVDAQQKYAGNVDKFMNKMKGNMPGKKKDRHNKRKGKHGASDALGGGGNLKIAKKALSKTQAKVPRNEKKGKRKGKGKR